LPRLRYETTEHTADVGMKAYGDTLKEAFENAAFGMFDMMIDTHSLPESRQIDISAEADDTESLLVAFLNELLFIFETESLALVRFEIVEWDEATRLSARAWGSPLADDTERREQIKAITYHDIRVVQGADRVEVEVLYDV